MIVVLMKVVRGQEVVVKWMVAGRIMLMLTLGWRRVEFGGENDARSRGDFHVSQILDKKLLTLRERSMFGLRWCYAK
jgi:hypothetical protein